VVASVAALEAGNRLGDLLGEALAEAAQALLRVDEAVGVKYGDELASEAFLVTLRHV
jgi:hypothetical protein